MLSFFNGRLSVTTRLAIAAGLFIISSAVSAFIQANTANTNIDFSKKEQLGTEYIQYVWQSLQTGNAAYLNDHERFDAVFNSAEQYKAFAEAKGWENRVAKAADLIVAVADGSNLTLDPDLDSYYAMDGVTVKLPTLLNSSLALSQAIAIPASDPDRRMKIALALDRFESAAAAAFGSLDTSMKNNAEGLTQQALSKPRSALQAATDAMTKAARDEMGGNTGRYAAMQRAFPAVLTKAWLATDGELARLLSVRVGNMTNGLIVDLVIVIVLIVLSQTLLLVVNFGLSRRFKALGQAMARLNRGDKTVDVPYLDDHNETGAIAQTLANMKQSLIARESEEKQREADRLAAAEAQKKAEADAQAKSEALVVGTFGEGLKALAEENLSFRLNADLPPAYRALKNNFNAAIGVFDQHRKDREDAARRRETDQAVATAAQRKAEEDAQARSMHLVVSSFGEGLKALAERNLAMRIEATLPDGYRALQADFNIALDNLSATMTGINRTAGDIAASAAQISEASQDLSQRTERQAASLEQTAAAMEEITATVSKSAENAREASNTAKSTHKDAELGRNVVKQTMTAMHDIAKSSSEIEQIIGVIDEIAFQTNLLAINAAVEAAHAGETGKGFAVVASEVRALAQRSADAAKEIKALINTSVSQVEGGVKLVDESGQALSRIVEDVAKISTLMTDIANAQKEQATALSEVNEAVGHMDQTTQQNAAMVEESTAASRSLAEDAKTLAGLVAAFKTDAEAKKDEPAQAA